MGALTTEGKEDKIVKALEGRGKPVVRNINAYVSTVEGITHATNDAELCAACRTGGRREGVVCIQFNPSLSVPERFRSTQVSISHGEVVMMGDAVPLKRRIGECPAYQAYERFNEVRVRVANNIHL